MGDHLILFRRRPEGNCGRITRPHKIALNPAGQCYFLEKASPISPVSILEQRLHLRALRLRSHRLELHDGDHPVGHLAGLHATARPSSVLPLDSHQVPRSSSAVAVSLCGSASNRRVDHRGRRHPHVRRDHEPLLPAPPRSGSPSRPAVHRAAARRRTGSASCEPPLHFLLVGQRRLQVDHRRRQSAGAGVQRGLEAGLGECSV